MNPSPSGDAEKNTDLAKASSEISPDEALARIGELLKASPSLKDGAELRALITSIQERYTYSGPTPPPDHLREVESVIPGGAERLLKMAEKNQDHQIAWEMKVLAIEGRSSILGLWFGVFALILLVSAALASLLMGYEGIALALVGTTALGLIPAFIKGRGLLNFWSKEDKNIPDRE